MFAVPDIDTLRLCSLLNTLGFGGLFLFLWLGRRTDRYLLYWAASGLLYGGLLVGFDYSGDHLWLNAVLMGLLAFSNMLPIMGFRDLEGRRVIERWMVLPVAVIVGCYVAPRLLADMMPVAQDITSGLETLGLAAAMAISGTVMARGPARGQRLAGGAMLAYLPAFALGYWAQLRGMPHGTLGMAPMIADQVLLGIINVGLLAIPFDRAQHRLQDAVLRDPLTGVLNRAGLRAQRPDIGVTLIAIDIDHFKQINDTFGHKTGDDVLVALAQEGDSLARAQNGVLARLGGDEFVMLLPATCRDPAGVGVLLRHRLQARQQRLEWSLSMGLATLLPGDDLTSALHRADQALYRAKAAGRDRLAA